MSSCEDPQQQLPKGIPIESIRSSLTMSISGKCETPLLNKLSLSPKNSMISPNLSPSHKRRESINIARAIINMNDKEQLTKALKMAPTVQSRIQIIDMIIQRRQELRDLENEAKLGRAIPKLREFTLGYRNKLHKKQEAEVENTFKKSSINDKAARTSSNQKTATKRSAKSTKHATMIVAMLENPPLPPPRRESTNFTNPPSLTASINDIDENKNEKVHRNKHRLSLFSHQRIETSVEKKKLSITSPKTSETMPPSTQECQEVASAILKSYGYMGHKKTNYYEPKNDSTSVSVSANRSMMSNSSFIDKRTQKDPASTFMRAVRSSISPKAAVNTEVKPEPMALSKALEHKRLLANYSEQAKSVFENDLYKFLVTNENIEGFNCVYSQFGQGKRASIKDIETKVLEKFESFTTKNKRCKNSLANSLIQEGTEELHNIKLKEERPNITRSMVKSTSKIHKPNADLLNRNMIQQAFSPRKPEKKVEHRRCISNIDIVPDDESFASYTEVQLDNLYRSTQKITKGIEVLDYKIECENKIKSPKFEVSKSKRLKMLLENAGEIMRVTHRKLYKE